MLWEPISKFENKLQRGKIVDGGQMLDSYKEVWQMTGLSIKKWNKKDKNKWE